MAEAVADSLRDQILGGELTVIPRLEDLISTYNVGPPAVREAMRILETEGLVTVRRGNIGGADVHLPTDDRVAYMVSMALQAKSTRLRDVGETLLHLEPLCAEMCAARKNRAKTVVPVLRELVDQQGKVVDDRFAVMEITDSFHAEIVRLCGNDTMILVVGALERVWASHATAVYHDDSPEPSPAVLKASLREHERIVAAIERGDPKVADVMAQHLEATQAYMSATDNARKVTAATLR